MATAGAAAGQAPTLTALNNHLIECRLCPRLVKHREAIAKQKRAAFRDETYWARPVPGFGDPAARLMVIGLAPAAHGGNRTGRLFTGGHASGSWLYPALYRAGFANQAHSTGRDDGLVLKDCYLSAAVRCAPPDNLPTPAEFARCAPYLERELELLTRLEVVLALGAKAFDSVLGAWKRLGHETPLPRAKFHHGAEVDLGEITLMASYHPSQRNTQTGLLTEVMFGAVFAAARERLGKAAVLTK